MNSISIFAKNRIRGVHSDVEQLGESCYERHIEVRRLGNFELKDLDLRRMDEVKKRLRGGCSAHIAVVCWCRFCWCDCHADLRVNVWRKACEIQVVSVRLFVSGGKQKTSWRPFRGCR